MMAKLKKVSILVALWVLFGIFNFGSTLAFFEGKYPVKSEVDKTEYRRIAAGVATLGPVGTIPAILCSEMLKYGWRVR